MQEFIKLMKIKILWASANDWRSLGWELRSLKEELAKIEKNLLALPNVQLETCKSVSLDQIWRKLLGSMKEKFQIFHFSGHSSPDTFILNREDKYQTPLSITTESFASHLAFPGTMRLVFLNSCRSERAGRYLVEDLGIPCAIVANANISEFESMAFAHTLYAIWASRGMGLESAFEQNCKRHPEIGNSFVLLHATHTTDYKDFILNP